MFLKTYALDGLPISQFQAVMPILGPIILLVVVTIGCVHVRDLVIRNSHSHISNFLFFNKGYLNKILYFSYKFFEIYNYF
jgi:hypothetical protein